MKRQAEQREIRRSVGVAIEARRRARGMSVTALAEAAQIDISQMVKILRGESGVSLYSLRRIAEALEWSPGKLVTAALPSRQPATRPIR